MKLTFVIANFWAVQCNLENLGVVIDPPRRTVTIELTPEQMRKLELREVGTKWDKPRFEEITTVFVEVDSLMCERGKNEEL